MRLSIKGHASISPLGVKKDDVFQAVHKEICFIKPGKGSFLGMQYAALGENGEEALLAIRGSRKLYQNLDRGTIMAITAARRAIANAGWQNEHDIGVNIGSSRGSTHEWEYYHQKHLQNQKERLSVNASPNTTLGNISSWVAQDLALTDICFSHSVTCSTALHSVVNAFAWIKSGMAKRFLAGGAEAPITSFTIQQMRSLGIYTEDVDIFPCKPLNGVRNTMALGEGAAIFCLEEATEQSDFVIKGVGYAMEKIKHSADISTKGNALSKAMQNAIAMTGETIDLVLLHAPGTIMGDRSELAALQHVFKGNLPLIWCSKWKLGHALGASGALSMECAIQILKSGKLPFSPFRKQEKKDASHITNILINAIGFGGNAVSIVIGKNESI